MQPAASRLLGLARATAHGAKTQTQCATPSPPPRACTTGPPCTGVQRMVALPTACPATSPAIERPCKAAPFLASQGGRARDPPMSGRRPGTAWHGCLLLRAGSAALLELYWARSEDSQPASLLCHSLLHDLFFLLFLHHRQ